MRSHWKDYRSHAWDSKKDAEGIQWAAVEVDKPASDMERRNEAQVIVYSAGLDEEEDMGCGGYWPEES